MHTAGIISLVENLSLWLQFINASFALCSILSLVDGRYCTPLEPGRLPSSSQLYVHFVFVLSHQILQVCQ